MDGHLPFPIKDLRLIVGGDVKVESDTSNEVHIKASISEPLRLMAFNRIWDLMFNRLSTKTKEDVTKKQLRQKLTNGWNP